MNSKVLRWGLFLLLTGAIGVAFVYRKQLDVTTLQQWVDNAGMAAPLLFMAIYALATVLFLPGSVITLAGGALFGPVLGTFYNLTGATIGAALAFLIARYLASDWAEQKIGGALRRLKEGVEKEGWRFVALVRLVPLFPFNLLNYALGLTRIRFRDYVIASYICMLPGAIAYTYLGYVGREAAAGGEGLVQKGLLALALLAVVAFLPRIIGRLRQGSTLSIDDLQQQLNQKQNPLLLDVRTAEDYASGHIAGALNIPLGDLEKRIDELARDLQRPIAIICTTDRRSRKAAQRLGREGFGDVQVVLGGMTQWLKQSLPVEVDT